MTNLLRNLTIAALAACAPAAAPSAPVSPPRPAREGPQDFAFHLGTWQTQIRRLPAGSTTWVEYSGTTVVREVWGGRANLVELVADGPAGSLELLSLRLYDPSTRQWSMHVASSRGGGISPPVVGHFDGGRGTFLGTETLDGRDIQVRFVISEITATRCHFEQAFSADGGATWDVNWIATDTR